MHANDDGMGRPARSSRLQLWVLPGFAWVARRLSPADKEFGPVLAGVKATSKEEVEPRGDKP
jgi:hypothetical protein